MDGNESLEETLLRNFNAGEQHGHTFFIIHQALNHTEHLIKLFSVIANVLIIFVIRKFPKLRTEENLILLNFCASDMILVLTEPLLYVLSILIQDLVHPHQAICSISDFEAGLSSFENNFAGLLAVHCYIKAYHPRVLEKYQRNYKTVIGGVYFGGVLQIVTGVLACFLLEIGTKHHHFLQLSNFAMIFLAVLAVCVAFLILVRSGKPPANSPRFSLTVSSVFFIFFLPIHLVYAVDQLFEGDLEMVKSIFRMVAFLYPIFNVYLLAKLSRHFQAAYRRIYRCQWRNYDNDFEEVEVEADRGGTFQL